MNGEFTPFVPRCRIASSQSAATKRVFAAVKRTLRDIFLHSGNEKTAFNDIFSYLCSLLIAECERQWGRGEAEKGGRGARKVKTLNSSEIYND